MVNIVKAIQTTSTMSDSSIKELTSHFTRIVLPKKHILVEADKMNRNVYFMEKGISRCYCIIDGKEVTTWFTKEGGTMFSMLGCYQNKPSHDYIQVLEKSIVYAIPMEILDELYLSNIEIANWGRINHQNAFLNIELRHIERLSKSAKERYLNLILSQPDLFQRANLGHIASYMGVSHVTLCNLRNGL